MFVGFQRPQVTWRDYNRPPSVVINPMSLPVVVNMGFGEFGFIQSILSIFSTFSSKRKAKRARRAARAAAAAELAKMEEEGRKNEEYLKKKWETEMSTRAES